ncbi:riboflavin kinase/FMN adenylyltransferase [Hasllibacter halocynthiae]|uniref:Riboflavin biosynthesis protein n=1 Tax=Hasllibacter halocynthiae TaxID=595589 RepID=A0A2T0X0Y7_9RHOB|nr:bifunctional riboflavin kinase/FAD synthetase [Hasllibacter halocynthiae]PRY92601.1 riboflavin kinase/FMN adenylyltransferase [Hasllibacter halocynthiae]
METLVIRGRDRGEAPAGCVAAMGNFDGVHLGHRAVIEAARVEAERRGAPLAVLTFEPHPREHFAPQSGPFRLMSPAARAERLAQLGVDVVFEVPFDDRLAALGAEGFVDEVIHRGLGLSHVVTGADFRFGKDREGDAEALAALCGARGIGTTALPVVDLQGAEVSSTAIRAALSEGRPEEAARMLGHLHRIVGPVEHGEKRGRTLGFPTANLSLGGLHRPRFGVYAVRADVLSGPHAGRYDGAASLGVRPQYGGGTPNLETFILDFDGDLYGETLSVGLARFIRPEGVFPTQEAFLARMREDVAEARKCLA